MLTQCNNNPDTTISTSKYNTTKKKIQTHHNATTTQTQEYQHQNIIQQHKHQHPHKQYSKPNTATDSTSKHNKTTISKSKHNVRAIITLASTIQPHETIATLT
jgi:hypothetical protein